VDAEVIGTESLPTMGFLVNLELLLSLEVHFGNAYLKISKGPFIQILQFLDVLMSSIKNQKH